MEEHNCTNNCVKCHGHKYIVVCDVFVYLDGAPLGDCGDIYGCQEVEKGGWTGEMKKFDSVQAANKWIKDNQGQMTHWGVFPDKKNLEVLRLGPAIEGARGQLQESELEFA